MPCFFDVAGTPFSSASRRMRTICSSVNLLFFIGFSCVAAGRCSHVSDWPKYRGQVTTTTTVGTYSFRLLRTPPAEEFTIAFGDTVSDGVPGPGAGNIEVAGAVDRYLFSATAGQVAIFDALAGSTNEVRWSLTAPDGTSLFDSFYVDQQATLPQTGTYVLAVRGLNFTTSGTYSFQLLDVPPQVDEFTIAFGDTVSDGVPGPGAGNIEVPGAVDRYLFDATAGQVAILDALTGSTTEVRWALAAPDGTTLFDAFYIDQQVTLPQSGTYALLVSGQGVTGSGTYSFQLREAPANTAPVAAADTVATDVNVAVVIDVLANDSDADGDPLVVSAVTPPTNGAASTDGSTVTYTPALGFVGTDAFTYTITDGRGGEATATVTVVVNEVIPPNQAPLLTAIDDQANVVGDTVLVTVDAIDPDGDPLSYAARGLPPGVAMDPATGEISGSIDAGADAGSPYLVEVTAADPDGATASTSFQWTVSPATTGPIAVDVDIIDWCIRNDGYGVIPVVIFGDDRVAAIKIDPATVELEGMPVKRVYRWWLAYVYDVNHDGVDDLVVLIDDVAGAIPAGAMTGTVRGALYDGTAIEGTDELCLTPS